MTERAGGLSLQAWSTSAAPPAVAGPGCGRYNQGFRPRGFAPTGRSFNGRTRGSGPRYRGSNPCLPARLRSRFARASSRSAAPRPTYQQASFPSREVCLDEARAASEGGPQFPLVAVNSKGATSAYTQVHPKACTQDHNRFWMARQMPLAPAMRGIGARFSTSSGATAIPRATTSVARQT